jgi:pimeloyl-ACP methyl ester carboxylesterase
VKTLTVELGGPLHYADFGGTGQPIVLVHGLGGSFVNWMAVGPALAKSGRVLAMDLPGFGRTPPAGRSVSIDAQVETVASFVERVAGGPSVVIGNSMGGMIASALAVRHANLVTRLVLVNPALPRGPGAPWDMRIALMLLAYTTPGVGLMLVRARRRWTARRYIDEMMTLCGIDTDRLPPDILTAMIELVEYRRTTTWADESFLDAARSLAGWTQLHPARYLAVLKRIARPTLLIHGTRDKLVPVALARAAARDCPSFSVEILEGIGHVPQLQIPDRFVDIVTRWLAPAERETAVTTGT